MSRTDCDVDPQSGFQDAADVAEDTLVSGRHGRGHRRRRLSRRVPARLHERGHRRRAGPGDVARLRSSASAGGSGRLRRRDDRRAEGPRRVPRSEAAPRCTARRPWRKLTSPGDSAWEASATATAGSDRDLEHGRRLHDRPGRCLGVDDAARRACADRRRAGARRRSSRRESRQSRPETSRIRRSRCPPTTTATAPKRDPSARADGARARRTCPPESSIKDDGYLTKGGDISFQRDFALGNATIGRSELVGLQTQR